MKKKAEIKALKNRVEVLEFKEAAKGERFILGDLYRGFPCGKQEIKWLSKDGRCVVTDGITLLPSEAVAFNGNYVEVRGVGGIDGVVSEAYRVKNDVLVDMDVEVYRKAFYPEKKTEEEKTEAEKTESPKVTHWRIGDRVRCIKAYEGNEYAVGKEGRIVVATEKDGRTVLGVRFDERIKVGHSLDGFVADGHGWWFFSPAEYLVKL